MRRGVVAGVLVLLATAGRRVEAQPSPDRETVAVTRLRDSARETAFSTYTGMLDSVRTVVRDSANWRTVWAQINRPFIPSPALPPIDFKREMVVVAGLGARPSGGYDIVIESVEQDSTGIEVALRRASPAPGCPVAAAMTQPLDMALIPASDQRVRFRERSVVIPCGVR
jgi:PrcB C-terminal